MTLLRLANAADGGAVLAAEDDFTRSLGDFDKHYTGRGDRFAAAVESALFAIVESPSGFPLLYEPGIRSAKVERFPYRIVYVVTGGVCLIFSGSRGRRTT